MISELIDKSFMDEHNKPSQTVQKKGQTLGALADSLKSVKSQRQVQCLQEEGKYHNNQYDDEMGFLKIQQKMSESSGNNVCTQCNKKFLKQAHLLRHINQRHKDNRSFVCKEPGCNKTFKRDSHLRRHMISHTHEKPHKCGQCIMAFGYKHHLDRHVKTIHEKSLLQCEECGQSFAKKKAFLKHVEKKHSNKNGSKDKPKSVKQDSKSDKTSKASKKKIIKKLKSKQKSQNALDNGNKQKIESDCDKIQIEQSISSSNQSDSQNLNHSIYEQSQEGNEGQNQIKKKKEDKKNDNQKLLFRCIYPDCISAFERMHQLMRHLKQVHKENQSINKSQNPNEISLQ